MILHIVVRLTEAGTREKSVVNEIFGGYLRSQGINHCIMAYICGFQLSSV